MTHYLRSTPTYCGNLKCGKVEKLKLSFQRMRKIDRYYDLIERLKKNPGRKEKYSIDQLEAIWNARQRFCGSLRRDLGLLRNASRMRLQLPEDEQ
ncbi:MAG: hypothetical protein EBU46_07750 [Nitrosomonadaceae bacterium]|nr:hypothetical protein [Nitrosomonadaceae bacterium]